MKTLYGLPLGTAVLLALLLAPSARPFGSKGHEIVGLLADRRIRPETRRELDRITRARSLAWLANWADCVREDRPETAPWHYVNLPPDAEGFVWERDVPPEGCVVERIEHFRRVLADRDRPAAERREALRWLVHLVADLHQPLHCSREADRGGNAIRVIYRGRETNLHAFWDTDLVEASGLSAAEYARELAREWDEAMFERARRGGPADWATESWRLARAFAYRDARGREIEDGHRMLRSDVTTRIPLVDERLSLAGLRLARLLDEALAPPK